MGERGLKISNQGLDRDTLEGGVDGEMLYSLSPPEERREKEYQKQLGKNTLANMKDISRSSGKCK